MTIESKADRFSRWGDAVAALILPHRCPICGNTLADRGRGWCIGCESGMKVLGEPVCAECRQFCRAESAECAGGHDPVDPRVIHAIGIFDDAWGALVRALKYAGCRALAKPLGELIADRFGQSQFDLVVAVPTTPAKLRRRGFGHAEEIARHSARALGAMTIPNALTFTRSVKDQTRLSAAKRRENLHEALRADPALPLSGRSVLLVDDVMTTGSTMREAARALRAAGASTITGAVIALNLSAQT